MIAQRSAVRRRSHRAGGDGVMKAADRRSIVGRSLAVNAGTSLFEHERHRPIELARAIVVHDRFGPAAVARSDLGQPRVHALRDAGRAI